MLRRAEVLGWPVLFLVAEHAGIVRLNKEAATAETANCPLALFPHRVCGRIAIQLALVQLSNGAATQHTHDIVNLVHQLKLQMSRQ
ncbi:MAG TPA: hypothetical protein VHX16_10965 [Chloroflexota bacterium]|jgi:hypothetical protein|nr:hypothetical protein [Chloroflexota bacterium]